MLPRPATPRATDPYRIEFAPATWNRIGLMPTDEFLAVRKELERLATEAGLSPQPSEQPVVLRGAVDDKVLVYARDDDQRTVTLLDILRRPEAP
jgi:hypothetical protein